MMVNMNVLYLVIFLLIAIACIITIWAVIFILKRKNINSLKESLSIKSVLKAILYGFLSFIAFYGVLAIIHFISESSFIEIGLMKLYLWRALIFAIAITFRRFYFGSIFFLGSVLGYIVNSIIIYLEQAQPTMLGGISNNLIVLFSVVIGIIVELVMVKKKAKKLTEEGLENQDI